MQLGPRVSWKTGDWLAFTFGTRNKGAEFMLEAFPELYRRCIADELRGKFTVPELSLLLDSFNVDKRGFRPDMAGRYIILRTADAIRLDHIDAKWGVDAVSFMEKINALSLFQRACLEIWSRAFWENGALELETRLEEWVRQLAKA